jgi:hypothetical protein
MRSFAALLAMFVAHQKRAFMAPKTKWLAGHRVMARVKQRYHFVLSVTRAQSLGYSDITQS